MKALVIIITCLLTVITILGLSALLIYWVAYRAVSDKESLTDRFYNYFDRKGIERAKRENMITEKDFYSIEDLRKWITNRPTKMDTINCTHDEVAEYISVFGGDTIALTDKDIEALKQGKLLAHLDEYSLFIAYERGEHEDE